MADSFELSDYKPPAGSRPCRQDDARPFQRGINSIRLVDDGSRWWIAGVLWRAGDERLKLPGRYLHRR